MHRVKWFRDQARIDRYTEEKEVVEVEKKRVVVAFEKMMNIWEDIGQDYNTQAKAGGLLSRTEAVLLGFEAYAYKQGDVYRQLVADVERQWALRTTVKPGKTTLGPLRKGEHTAEAVAEDVEEDWEDLDDFAYLEGEVVEEED